MDYVSMPLGLTLISGSIALFCNLIMQMLF